MKTFTDTAGRTWNLVVNITAMKRVRSLARVDLMDVIVDGGRTLERLAADPILLADILYALCQPQAEAQGVSDVQFGEGLAGDAVEQATVALLEELTDFFPAARRAVLAKMLATLKRASATALRLATEEVNRPDLDARIEAELRAQLTSGVSSGSGPASSASIPAPSPSPS